MNKHPNPVAIEKMVWQFRNYTANNSEPLAVDMVHGPTNPRDIKLGFMGSLGAHAALYWVINSPEALDINDIASLPAYDTAGANLMAQHLLEDEAATSEDLAKWAWKNDRIWGNIDGRSMFNVLGAEAFDCRRYHGWPVIQIADHWEAIAVRMKKRIKIPC